MKQSILNNWYFFRFLRLVIGITIIVQGILAQDMLFGMVGLLFTGMAVFNTGCCGTGGCNVPIKKTVQPEKDIDYEEVV